MTEVPSFQPEDRLASYVLGRYGEPPYARRGRAAEEAYEDLLERCRRQREKLLAEVRQSLGRLRALAGDWLVLRPLLADEAQIAVLGGLAAVVQPPEGPAVPASTRRQRQALRDLAEQVDRFNSNWGEFLGTLDLSEVNALRDGYNRYYVLEKEIALRSPVLARRGFQPLPPLTAADLFAQLPLLTTPQPAP